MQNVRQSWTDERLDDFAAQTYRRFDRVDAELLALNARFDALQRTLLQIGGGLIATLVAGFFSVIITQP